MLLTTLMRKQKNVLLTLLALMSLLLPLDHAYSKVVCRDLESALEVFDDVCESVSSAAEQCFKELNLQYEFLKKPGDSRESRLKAIAVLRSDYQRELNKLKKKFLPYIEKLGAGKSCTDQVAEVEVWIEEMTSDLNDLKRPGF